MSRSLMLESKLFGETTYLRPRSTGSFAGRFKRPSGMAASSAYAVRAVDAHLPGYNIDTLGT